jgi:hypothetical protein
MASVATAVASHSDQHAEASVAQPGGKLSLDEVIDVVALRRDEFDRLSHVPRV